MTKCVICRKELMVNAEKNYILPFVCICFECIIKQNEKTRKKFMT